MADTSASRRVNVMIEPLQDKDVGELLTVQRAAFLLDAQLYGNPFLPSHTQTLDQLRAEASDPNRVFLVAKLGARVVGISWLAVRAPSHGASRIRRSSSPRLRENLDCKGLIAERRLMA